MQKKKVNISIILPSYNEGENLQNLVENIFMKSYWTRIPTVPQNPFGNESIIPIVVENCFYEVYRTRTSSTKSVVIRISTLSVLKSLCPAGAHLACAVLQGLERMFPLCVHNAMILRVPKGWFYLTFPFGK